MMRQIMYGQDSKAHEWDFTLSAKREIVSVKVPLQTEDSLKGTNILGVGGTLVARALGWQFVKALGRIVR